jgi:hypothetical protein
VTCATALKIVYILGCVFNQVADRNISQQQHNQGTVFPGSLHTMTIAAGTQTINWHEEEYHSNPPQVH